MMILQQKLTNLKNQFGEGEEAHIYNIDDNDEEEQEEEEEEELDRDDDDDDGLPPIADPFNPNNRARW